MLTVAEREHLIYSYPFFSLLIDEDVIELAKLMEEVHIPKGEVITKEKDSVKNIDLIASGIAEVSRSSITYEVKHAVVIAKLGKGDAIGLMETGIFSQTGKRTATITALSDMTVLRIDLKTLYDFMRHDSRLYKNFSKAAHVLLQMNLIKHIAPFEQLSEENVKLLIDNIESESIPAGEYIFHEGDPGNVCYLLEEGEIEIRRKNKVHEELICVLHSPSVFGETSILTKHRNASAYVKVASKILSIKNDILVDILKKENHVAQSMEVIIQLRSRPKKFSYIAEIESRTEDGEDFMLLKNTETNQYMILSKLEWNVWKKLDGKHDIQSLLKRYSDQFNNESKEYIEPFILKMAKNQFIDVPLLQPSLKKKKSTSWIRLLFSKIRNS